MLSGGHGDIPRPQGAQHGVGGLWGILVFGELRSYRIVTHDVKGNVANLVTFAIEAPGMAQL